VANDLAGGASTGTDLTSERRSTIRDEPATLEGSAAGELEVLFADAAFRRPAEDIPVVMANGVLLSATASWLEMGQTVLARDGAVDVNEGRNSTSRFCGCLRIDCAQPPAAGFLLPFPVWSAETREFDAEATETFGTGSWPTSLPMSVRFTSGVSYRMLLLCDIAADTMTSLPPVAVLSCDVIAVLQQKDPTSGFKTHRFRSNLTIYKSFERGRGQGHVTPLIFGH